MSTLVYALLVPAFQNPDETQHVDMILQAGELEQWPKVREHVVAPRIRAAQGLSMFARRNHPRAASEALDRSERPAFFQLDGSAPEGAPNHINQHPPLYYVAAHTWLTAVTTISPVDFTAYDRSVFLVRAFGSFLAFGVVIFSWKSAIALRLPKRNALIAASIPLVIPMFAYVFSSANNDSLVVFLLAAATYCACKTTMGDLGGWKSVALGALVGLAMMTKFFGFFFLPVLVAAPFLSSVKSSVARRLRHVSISMSVMFVSGGWWWVRNLAVEGRLQPSGMPPRFLEGVRESVSLVPYIDGLNVRFWQGFFGRFGFLNTALPSWVLLVLTFFTATLLAAGLWRLWRRRHAERLRVLAVSLMAAPGAVIAVVILYRSFDRYLTVGRMSGAQGRYIFSAIVGLALLAAWGGGLTRFSSRAALVVAGPMILLAHSSAAHSILRNFWGEQDGPLSASITALEAWSPFAPRWTWGVVGLGLVGLLGTTFALVRSGLDGSDGAARRPSLGRVSITR